MDIDRDSKMDLGFGPYWTRETYGAILKGEISKNGLVDIKT